MRERKKSIITKEQKNMTGEIAEIKLHLFDNGMFVECEDTGDGKFIIKGDLRPLVDLINEVSNTMSGVFQITEEERKEIAEYARNR